MLYILLLYTIHVIVVFAEHPQWMPQVASSCRGLTPAATHVPMAAAW